jgi:hypothetical protein
VIGSVWRVAAALALVALIAGCGQSRQRPPAPRVATIVQDDAELLHRSPQRIASTLDDLRDLGVDWVRVTAGWSVIAPSPTAARRPDFDATDPDAYPPGAWAALDRLVAMAADRGLRVSIDIAFWAPRWAVGRAGPRPERERDSIAVSDFADFSQAVARRYPQAVAFTIWNEPNHPAFMQPQWERANGSWRPASPHRYRAMVQAAVPRIRGAAPGALVLIGGTSSIGSAAADRSTAGMAPLTFLREMACVDQRLRPLRRPECRSFEPLPGDGWAHHPYSTDLTPYERDPRPANVRIGELDRLTSLLAGLHAIGRTRTALPLYLTEYGYQTNPPDPTSRTSLAEQARWLSEAEQVARSQPTVLGVSQFLLRDLPERAGHDLRSRWSDYQSGLRFADGRPKPAYAAYALALVARRADARHVAFWGLVRPGTGVRDARISVLEAGATWRSVVRLKTRPDGTFSVTVAVDPAGTFRLQSGSRMGPALDGAR